MYIPLNSSFKFRWISSLLKGASFTGQTWKTKMGDRVIRFSRGRWALALLVLDLLRYKEKKTGTIFVPDFFCEISLATLRAKKNNLHFYHITPNFEPDMDHLNSLTKQFGAPDVFLLVHYFGFPSKIKNINNWCQQHKVLLIEDAAHALLPIPGIGNHDNPVLFTPWKFFNVLEGALLVLPEPMSNLVTEHAGLNRSAGYPKPWLAKKLLQALIARLNFPLHQIRPIYVKKEDESESVSEIQNPFCSDFSERILSNLEGEITRVAGIRQRNYGLLDQLLINQVIPAQRLFTTLPPKFGPYLYPLRVLNGKCREIMISLNRRGIPALPWSDLSPEVKNSKEYPLANALRREVLTLPVHQDLTEQQIKWLVQELINELCNTH